MIDRFQMARNLLMQEAREQDKRGDMLTHHHLMMTVAVLDDAVTSAKSYQFIQNRINQNDDLPDRARDQQRERLRLAKGEEAETEERRKIGER